MKTILTIFGLFFLWLTVSAQTVDLNRGLVAFYPFNGSANDESSNGNNGNVFGAYFDSDRNGKSNSAISLSGNNSYIQLPSGSSTSLNITSDLTVSIWFKTTDGAKGLVDLGDNYSGAGGYLIMLGGANLGYGKITVYTGTSWYSTNSSFADNRWHNLVVLIDSHTLKIYVDNNLESKISNVSAPSSWNGKRSLGSLNDGNAMFLKGCIDDMRIYNRALNVSEIDALYTESDKNPRLDISNFALINPKGNNTIGTYQTANIKFNISNIGKGDAKNVEVKISETNYASGLEYPTTKVIGDMVIGNSQEISIPIKANKELTNGTANFSVQLIEKNGFNSSQKTLSVATKSIKSLTEEIKMYVENKVNEWQQKGEFENSSEYKIRVNETTRAKKIEEFQTEAIKEFKKQYAQSIDFGEIKLNPYDADNECFLLSSSQLGEFVVPVPRADAPAFKQSFSSLKFRNSDFFIKDDNFVLSHIDIVDANSKIFRFDSKTKATYASTKIDYKFTEIEVDVEDKTASNSNIQKSTNKITVGKSEVDVDIPVNTIAKTNTYALIIGNEDYSSFQTGLNTEINVDFAMNDAKLFKEYCIKTLGIPEKQVKLLINATSGQMNQGIAWINNLSKIENGNAELIFYYSGHGLPDEQTKESYLMPVDISGSNVTQAVKLTDVYNKLNEFPSKKVSVFLDACFSGGARNQGLIAMKGVKIKPKENMVSGNMVVLSSSTGEESSGVYREKQHGYMTYYLLKKLQETKGNISYKELADYVIENVKKETALNGKNQTPQLNYSSNVDGIWTNWKIK